MRTLVILCAFALVSCDACTELVEKFRRDDTPSLPELSAPLLDYQGRLTDTAGGQLMAGFDVVVEPGMRLQVTVESSAFDPILFVTPPGHAAQQNDDWQGSRTLSRVDLIIDTPGVMKVGVSSYAPNATGDYRVLVQRQAQAPAANPIRVGEPHRGRLEAGSPQLPDGRYFQQFEIPGAQSHPLNLRALGEANAPLPSVVTRADGSYVMPSPDGTYTITHPEPHRLQVMSPTPNTATDFSLSLSAASPGATPTLSRDHHLLPTQTTGTPIARGETVNGQLNAGSPRLPSNEPLSLYTLEVNAPLQPFAVNLTSSDLDPYVMVIAPNGDHWENDDSGGGTNSFLEVQPPVPGVYRIAVTAYRANEVGGYTLKVLDTDRDISPDAGPVTGPAADPAAQPAGPSTITRAGSLAAGDSQLQTGEFTDRYPFNWTSGQSIRIRLNAPSFDPYLILRTPDGQQHDNDDLSEGDLNNSGLDHQVTQDGQYVVLVTSYRPGETGDYTLTIDGASGSPTTPPAPSPATPSSAEGAINRGELATGDSRLPSGEFYDAHEFEWTAGQAVRIEARSNAFDTYLIVRPPTGTQQDNDDQSPGVTDAALSFVAAESGRYRVLVTSYRPGMQGAYELVVSDGGHAQSPTPTPSSTPDEAAPTPAEPAAPSAPSAPTGEPIRGSLQAGDSRLNSGEFMDIHSLDFETGSSVQIRLTSSSFDPYLIVRTPSGQQLDNDDLTPETRDSGIDIPVAEDGTYRITVTSYRPGETGDYTLQFGSGSPVPRPGNSASGGGQVYGLFAGISDYPPGVGDLPECANDAIKLAETLRNRGLLTTERQVVLTDSQATVANIRNAMQQMAARLRPEDVFVFFYSGHGGQTASSTDVRELDQRDEFLAVYDGQLLDDELGTLFDSVNARLSVVAIDACHAGGLAKDIITRPGRVGLFSSEEDVLSAVASQFQAGGYLSHFLRTGMGGAADSEPNDGVLTVGELTHYLYTQFGTHAQDVHRAASYQHLVMDRGAVRVDHVMWSYR